MSVSPMFPFLCDAETRSGACFNMSDEQPDESEQKSKLAVNINAHLQPGVASPFTERLAWFKQAANAQRTPAPRLPPTPETRKPPASVSSATPKGSTTSVASEAKATAQPETKGHKRRYSAPK